MLPTMSGVGRLTAPPELRFTAAGMAIATINLAFNNRKRDESGNWVDGDVFFVRATAFKQLAESAVETLDRGMEVVVSGRLKTEQWNDKTTGEKRSAVSLLLDAIGPNLAFATAKVSKSDRSSREPAYSTPVGGGATTDDPWGASEELPPF